MTAKPRPQIQTSLDKLKAWISNNKQQITKNTEQQQDPNYDQEQQQEQYNAK